MKTISKWTTALAFLHGAAVGQVPSTNDTSATEGGAGTMASIPAAAVSVQITSFEGRWAATASYTPGEVVTYKGASYICLAGNTGVAPISNATDWAILNARGAIGPAGPGGLSVVDSVGTVVGSYVFTSPSQPTTHPIYPSEFVFIRSFSIPFALSLTPNALGGNTLPLSDWFYYPTSDCSGTAYLGFNYGTVGMLRFGIVGGMTVYVGSTTYIGITPQSYMQLTPGGLNGPCATLNAASTLRVAPIVATFDLSTLNLVPPYSVE